MIALYSAGRVVFALGFTAIGLLSLVFSEYVSGLQPLPPDLPGHLAVALVTGGVLLLCGIGMLSPGTARTAALTLAVLLLAACLLIHLPILIDNLRVSYSWVRLFETLALAGAALTLVGMLGASHAQNSGSGRSIKIGRLLFGASLPVFAATHFIYPDFVAALIPAWIPARLFWAWFTGAAHLLAGLAIVTNIQVRLAGTLAGAMYGSWALILHLPRVMADIGNQGEITSLFVAVVLCGGAWLVASSVKTADATSTSASRARVDATD